MSKEFRKAYLSTDEGVNEILFSEIKKGDVFTLTEGDTDEIVKDSEGNTIFTATSDAYYDDIMEQWVVETK